MGKFKVGDRVIAGEGNGWVPTGTTGTVAENDFVPFVDWDNGSRLAVSENKLSAVVPAWQPKVGDRVRFTKDNPNGGSNYGAKGEVFEVVGNVSHSDCYGDQVSIKHQTIVWNPSAPISALEPATFTIEAGKFYKTRDGRKVGPMVDYGSAPGEDLSTAEVGGIMKLFNRDGTHHYKNHDIDLIAEWVDEPVAVAASNDNAAPAKPTKFKVGDRVRFRSGYASCAAGNEATVVAVNVWGDDGIQVDQGGYDGVSTEAEKDLELVTPTKFKVGDRIKGNSPGAGLITGEVVDVDDDDDDMTYRVLQDGNEYPLWVYSNTVEAAPLVPTAIVALIEDGQPKPATRPYVHASEAAAAKEADRLASIHKGQQFGVYVLTTTSQEAAPTYAHEWQRLAAKGEKIAAIKELRGMTGMPLRQSKDVVEHFIDSPYGEIAA